MAGRTITLFMWGFQSTYRRSLEFDLQSSLEAIGAPDITPTILLIGVLKDGGSGHPLCIEPERGPIVPADFAGLHDRANDLYQQDPRGKSGTATLRTGSTSARNKSPAAVHTAWRSVRYWSKSSGSGFSLHCLRR